METLLLVFLLVFSLTLLLTVVFKKEDSFYFEIGLTLGPSQLALVCLAIVLVVLLAVWLQR